MISICNVPCMSTEEFLCEFPGLPLPAKPGSFLLMQILYKKGVSRAGSCSRKIPQAKLELQEHLWQGWLYACKVILFAIQLETCTLQENAGPAVGSLSGAITIDKDEEFREFTDNSNEGSHHMWEKAYFSSRTERKQALKNQSGVSLLKRREGAKAGITAASGTVLLSNYQRNCCNQMPSVTFMH